MKLQSIFIFLFLSTFLFATENPIELKSTIKKVIVFKQGAQVTRKVETTIPKGKSIIKFIDITSNLNPKSIQLKGIGDFTVLSVNHQLNFLETTEKTEALIKLEDQVTQLQKEMEEWDIQIDVLEDEEQLILNNNKRIGAKGESLSIEALKSMATYYRSQLAEIRLAKLKLKRQIKEQLKEVLKFQQQINENKNKNQEVETSEILVTLFADAPVKGKFELNYFVLEAGWSPTYDIRVKDVQSPINLGYKANVFQSTGELWKEVKLTLSTANPKKSGRKPILNKWNLDFYNPYAYTRQEYFEDKSDIAINGIGGRIIKGRIFDDSGETLIGASILIPGTTTGTITDLNGYYVITVPYGINQLEVSYTGYASRVVSLGNSNKVDISLEEGLALSEVVVSGYAKSGRKRFPKKQKEREKKTKPIEISTNEKTTSVEFEIEIPYTIQSDGKEYMVSIKELNISAYFEYYCVPKLDKNAFLTAMITGWEDYHLLSGTTNLYFEETFIGSAFLDVKNLKDTLNISLGRDENIIVERTRLKDFTKKQFIGNKKTESRTFEIAIRNKKGQPINLVVEDQFPISVNSDIEVKRGNYKRANLEEKSGKLTWKLSLKPKSQEKIGFDYSVKYPKKEQILLEE